ncbi:YraN family protein [Candidatus Dojkabacteria bacterium]|nr:YraN family protein [Candidatus Dojkabacteria bacterium]
MYNHLKTNNKKTGREGEDLALEYLRTQGLNLVERNYLIWGGELDLIMRDGEEYVFVEVKTRFDKEIPFEELISAKKLRTIEKTSELWLRKNKFDDVNWRIDFVGVDLTSGDVEWIPDCTC